MGNTIEHLDVAVQEFGCLSAEVMQRQIMLTEQQQRLELHPNLIGSLMEASADVRRLRQRARSHLARITELLEQFRSTPTLTQAECAQIADLCHQALEMCLMSGLEGDLIIRAEAEFRQRCQ